MKTIDAFFLSDLSVAAKTNPRLRQHHNFHDRLDDPCQRLLIAMEPGSYLQPHRHLLYPKPELFVALRGLLCVVTFSDIGDMVSVFVLSPNSKTIAVEIPPGVWHTAVSLEAGSVFMEVKPGPYQPLPDGDKAPWAPPENSHGAEDYLAQVSNQARNRCSMERFSQ